MTEMRDHEVEIYPAGDLGETARKLLDAAAELGLPVETVATVSDGGFRVPREVADKTGVTPKVDNGDDTSEEPTPKRPRSRR